MSLSIHPPTSNGQIPVEDLQDVRPPWLLDDGHLVYVRGKGALRSAPPPSPVPMPSTSLWVDVGQVVPLSHAPRLAELVAHVLQSDVGQEVGVLLVVRV